MSTLEVYHSDEQLPSAPSWHRARCLYEVAQKRAQESADALHQLAGELRALRAAFFAERAGAGRPRTDREIASQGATQFPDAATGWQEKVREELGISHHTALRIIERSQYVTRLQLLAEGQPVEVEATATPHGYRRIEPTDAMAQLAREALDAVLRGEKAAPRAWAGVVGEGERQRAAGPGGGRQPISHARNIARGITALETSLPYWHDLTPRERQVLEEEFLKIRNLVPPSWLR